MSTATTSDLVRRMIQLTHVSSLSMTVSRIWSFSLADNCVLRWTSGWRVTRGRYLWVPDCLWQTLIERTCPCTSSLRHGMITNLLRPGLQLQRATWRRFRISLCTLATIPDLESTRSSCGYVLCRRIVFVQLFLLCSRSCGVPKEHVLYFNLQEIHACYGWQAAATAAAELLIQQLDSGIRSFREGIKHCRGHMVTRRRPLFHFPVAPRRQ